MLGAAMVLGGARQTCSALAAFDSMSPLKMRSVAVYAQHISTSVQRRLRAGSGRARAVESHLACGGWRVRLVSGGRLGGSGTAQVYVGRVAGSACVRVCVHTDHS